jgi:hypothetical protein
MSELFRRVAFPVVASILMVSLAYAVNCTHELKVETHCQLPICLCSTIQNQIDCDSPFAVSYFRGTADSFKSICGHPEGWAGPRYYYQGPQTVGGCGWRMELWGLCSWQDGKCVCDAVDDGGWINTWATLTRPNCLSDCGSGGGNFAP